ncbi:hypothetical protein [Bradyrhizobium sp. CW1]|uniref:hypothetical protein n=1 Tax=Bradyrhizobium sp. CW1 TaxID=2782686 RepID=UPI001FFFADF5|nr:hypothetical protein [Bradyrhizobium sp. CW1]UPJ29873.1 hypothetical protein IVB54_13120 [Bradyrhizobium sp. CW1]
MMRVFFVVLALLVLYFPIALVLNKSSQPDPTLLSGPFIRFADSNAFISYPVIPGATPDDEDHPEQSTLSLFEDGRQLGPAHSVHRDVTVEGRGRYSFWRDNGTMLIFSTSDNSDPNTNGRTYRASDPGARDPFEAQRR